MGLALVVACAFVLLRSGKDNQAGTESTVDAAPPAEKENASKAVAGGEVNKEAEGRPLGGKKAEDRPLEDRKPKTEVPIKPPAEPDTKQEGPANPPLPPVPDNVVKEKLPQMENSAGMKLVRIPAGKFWMGSSVKRGNRMDNEFPRHEVEITRAFYMGVHEVTQQQYQTVMGNNPSWFSATGGGKDKVQGLDTSDFPVESVSWIDAVNFCKKLSGLPAERKAGRTYRLPTEAEWEYACRAGTATPYHFGRFLSDRLANAGSALGRTCPVGSYPPNAWGLHDMHGNVAEWCADVFNPAYYSKSPARDPQGPKGSGPRVLRGGGFAGKEKDQHARSAYRARRPPTQAIPGTGFRVAVDVVEQ
jgi:formylglycine-generating enzyme required for sulfatase activity